MEDSERSEAPLHLHAHPDLEVQLDAQIDEAVAAMVETVNALLIATGDTMEGVAAREWAIDEFARRWRSADTDEAIAEFGHGG